MALRPQSTVYATGDFPGYDLPPDTLNPQDKNGPRLGFGLKKRTTEKNPFKQQTLVNYLPVTTPTFAAVPLILIASALLPLGVWIRNHENPSNQVIFDYTDCSTLATSTFAPPPASDDKYSHVSQWKYDSSTTTCSVQLRIPERLNSPVYLYLRLENYYQNHRLYMGSASPDQLSGSTYLDAANIPGQCSWLRYANCETAASLGGSTAVMSNPDCFPAPANRDPVIQTANPAAQYFPCGLVANSMFSDQISSLTCLSTSNGTCPPPLPFSTLHISPKATKALYGTSSWFTDPGLVPAINYYLIPPPAWRAHFPEYATGYNSTTYPDFENWERFQVWMREAGFPTFRKLWGRIDSPIPAGTYQLDLTGDYDVRRFGGRKGFVLTGLGPVGAKTGVAAMAYLVVGSLAGVCALAICLVRWRRPGDKSQLSWNKDKIE
ncbi:ligand-effect modulator 3 family [Phlyctochytrium arcticum]|nr:ligand-effect modulator 3 family [Phlyctochytrium arcticum]